MTIGVGFVSGQGLVLAADSYEAVQGYYKGSVQKIKVTPHGGGYVGYIGSGPSTLCDALEQEILERILETKWDFKKNIRLVKDVVRRFYGTHIWPDPARPVMGALIALQDRTDTALLRTMDSSTVTRHHDYASIGIGAYVADHWKARIFPWNNAGPLDQLAAAVYLIWQAKQTVDGCDRWTNVSIFGRDMYLAGGAPVRELEAGFQKLHEAYGLLLGNLSSPRCNVTEAIDTFATRARAAMSGPESYYAAVRDLRSVLNMPTPSVEQERPAKRPSRTSSTRATKSRPPSRV